MRRLIKLSLQDNINGNLTFTKKKLSTHLSINNKIKFDHKHDLFTLVNVLQQRVTITTGVRQKEE